MNELHTNHEQSTAHKPALHPKESQKGAKDCETYQEMGTESLGESEAVSRALTQVIDFSDKGVFMRGCELLDNNPDVLMQVRGTKVVHTVLREARVAVSLTISSAAELAGIAHSAVSRWENGHRISHPKYIAALAIVYGVHPSILQNGAET